MPDKHPTTLPAVLAAVDAADNPQLAAVLSRCTSDEQRALIGALRAAYEAGQDAADQRAGKLMARIFGGFVGVTPGIDLDTRDDKTPRTRLADVVRLLGSVAARR